MTDTLLIRQPIYGGDVTAQTVPDMTVHVARGAILYDNVPESFPPADLTITTADTDIDRLDAIVADSTGTLAVLDGAVVSNLNVQPPDTSAYVLEAFVYVYSQAHPAYTGTITDEVITDVRDMYPIPTDPGIVGYGADGDLVYDGGDYDDPFFPGGYLIGNVDADTGYLVRDASFSNLTINAGKTLQTNGFILRVANLLVSNGTIENDGQTGEDGGATTPGVGGVGGTTGFRLAIGGTFDSNWGGHGGDVGTGWTGAPATGERTIWAGEGGTGGTSGIHAGGAPSGTVDPSSSIGAFGPPDSPIYLLAAAANVAPGGGGGGGGGDSVGVQGGGGGGSGGGIVAVFARVIDNNDGTITAKGGGGGAGEGGDAAGGAAGGGGTIVLYGVVVTGTITVAGGTGGLGAGTGNPGADGTDGNVFKIGIL